MKTTNAVGVIAQWKAEMERWASTGDIDIHRQAVNAWLPYWSPRPFYTAEELAPIVPALALMFGWIGRWPGEKSPNRLANELEFAGLPKLENASGGFDFRHPMTGKLARFFIVEQLKKWKEQPLTQREFEEFFK